MRHAQALQKNDGILTRHHDVAGTAQSTSDAQIEPSPPASLDRLGDAGPNDPAQRHRTTLQRLPSDALRQQFIRTLGCHVGNALVQRLIADAPTALQRDTASPSEKDPFTTAREAFSAAINQGDHEAVLAGIQGLPMYDLLPKLAALPNEARSDERAGAAVGGPRLVAAMHVIAAKGKSWSDFVDNHNGELASLPADQIGDMISYLGGARGAYYKQDEFAGKFDGAVDASAGIVTLYFRVRFEVEGARFGGAPPGTPEWEKETREGMEKFKREFKQVVEDTWSFKGKIKPACPVGPIKLFQTRVIVTVVESGEHKLFHLFSAGGGRSNASSVAGADGNLQVGDTENRTSTSTVIDPAGKRSEQITTTHSTAAHEFGHAIGLHHPRCPGGEDSCYGVTAEERRDVMGAGNVLQAIKRNGRTIHDDFEPFEQIATRWGQDILPNALAKCNIWSPA